MTRVVLEQNLCLVIGSPLDLKSLTKNPPYFCVTDVKVEGGLEAEKGILDLDLRWIGFKHSAI